jgi:phage FluMu protein Com
MSNPQLPYWRTIAEAQEQGYTHVRVYCPQCNHTSDVSWTLVLQRRVSRESFIGNIKLRCTRCGKGPAPVVVGVQHRPP